MYHSYKRFDINKIWRQVKFHVIRIPNYINYNNINFNDIYHSFKRFDIKN